MATKKKSEAQKTSLVLRTCAADLTSKNGFQWPQVGETAIAYDWVNNKECGQGLHGWLYGQGDHDCSNYLDDTAKWLVVEVQTAGIVMLGGKCKFESGVVRFIGDKKSATDFLIANEPQSASVAVIGASLVVGDSQSVIVGALGTATAGDRGTATAGDSGTATAGDRGTATAGDSGTATAGYRGTATAGDSGTATAGYSGTATAGDRGTICIKFYDYKNERYRTVVGYTGEDGIEPNVAYKLDDKNKLVKA